MMDGKSSRKFGSDVFRWVGMINQHRFILSKSESTTTTTKTLSASSYRIINIIMFQLKNVACTLLILSTTSLAFTPNKVAFQRSTSTSTSSLGVSVVSEFLANHHHPSSLSKQRAADQIKGVFETETPESVGVKGSGIQQGYKTKDETSSANNNKRYRKPHRKHNYADQEQFLQQKPDLDFYTLHSSVVSHLHRDMPINDVTRAIKRAQNLHDAHDMKTIGAFLMEECDEHWGYGFRGTLLSRLAVAALHIKENDLALDAIDMRRIYERPSMQPFESAGIVRGLLRAGLKEKAWDVLEDELRLPMTGTRLSSRSSQEMLKHRAHALSSIATRYFYQGQPKESERALSKLASLGSFIAESNMQFEDLGMPWMRLEEAALECNKMMEKQNGQQQQSGDLRELVWNAMVEFPCPGHEEECSLDSYFLTA